MLLKIVDNGKFRDVLIREGETFLVSGINEQTLILSIPIFSTLIDP